MIVKQHAALIQSSTDVHHMCLYVSANYNSWKCDSSNQILEPELLYMVICGGRFGWLDRWIDLDG